MKRIDAGTIAGICAGSLTAALISFDGYLSNVAARQLGIVLSGKNLMKLFPYEVTMLVLAMVPLLLGVVALFRYCILHSERAFIFIFLLGLHVTALTDMGRLDLSEFALVFFFLVALVRSLNRFRKMVFTTLDFINFLFAAAVFLSSVNGGVVIFLSSTLTMVKFALILINFTNSLRTRDDIVFTLKWFVILTVISSIVAIGQEIIYASTKVAVVGMVNKTALRLMFQEEFGTTLLRVPAFFGSYKSFSFFLTTSLLVLFHYSIYNRPFKTRERALIIMAALLMIVALGLTFSNDGFIALLIGLLLSLVVWRPRYILHLGAAGMLLVVLITALGYWETLGDKLMAELRYGEQRMRVQLLRDGLEGFVHRNHLVGAGVTNAKKYTGHFFGWPVHNSIVEAADDTGAIGLLAYLALLIYPFARLVRVNLTVRDMSDLWIARGLLFGFISFFVALQFHPFYLEKFNWLMITVIQMFVIIHDRGNDAPEDTHDRVAGGPDGMFRLNAEVIPRL